MKLFPEYLKEAEPYLEYSQLGNVKTEKEIIRRITLQYGLEEDFNSKVKSNDSWRNLAEKDGVSYFIDISKKVYFVPSGRPYLKLLELELGTKAVFKLVVSEEILRKHAIQP